MITASRRFRPFVLLAAALLFGESMLSASYVLSLGTYPPKEAEALHQQLSVQGYPVYLLYGDNCEVRVGGYAAKEEAEQMVEKLKSEEKIVARVVEEEDWDQSQFNWTPEAGGADREVSEATAQGYSDPRAQKIVSLGLDLFGHPYKYGGTRVGKGIDCSYFVQIIFRELGIQLPRTSGEQFRIGTPVEIPQLKVGDLVFFQKAYRVRRRSRKAPKYVTRINHVAIYIGNGEIIHATINVKHVTISRLDEAYFMKRFAGARRILPEQTQSEGSLPF